MSYAHVAIFHLLVMYTCFQDFTAEVTTLTNTDTYVYHMEPDLHIAVTFSFLSTML